MPLEEETKSSFDVQPLPPCQLLFLFRLHTTTRTCPKKKKKAKDHTDARQKRTTAVQCTSRRSAPSVPTTYVLEVHSPRTDIRAIIHPDVPALNICFVWAADNYVSTVEVRGAAESYQANIEFKAQIKENHVCDLVVEGPGRPV
jgi:hypothetical protein